MTPTATNSMLFAFIGGITFNIINIAIIVLIIYTLILMIKVLRKANNALDVYLRNNDDETR